MANRSAAASRLIDRRTVLQVAAALAAAGPALMREGHAAARPPVVIDAQVHAYAANTPERPWHSVPNWPAHVTGDEMVAAMASGRWKSGSAMAPRAVLDRVMWSSLTTSRARTTRHAGWEFRGSVPL